MSRLWPYEAIRHVLTGLFVRLYAVQKETSLGDDERWIGSDKRSWSDFWFMLWTRETIRHLIQKSQAGIQGQWFPDANTSLHAPIKLYGIVLNCIRGNFTLFLGSINRNLKTSDTEARHSTWSWATHIISFHLPMLRLNIIIFLSASRLFK
jgi:hypothetical protein